MLDNNLNRFLKTELRLDLWVQVTTVEEDSKLEVEKIINFKKNNKLWQ